MKTTPPSGAEAPASAASSHSTIASQAITVQVLPPKKEESLTDFALAWSTPLIAAIAAGITLRQWATARQAHRLSMFDRRWTVYKGVRQLVGEASLKGFVDEAALRRFLLATEGAAWLFDKDMGVYLDELYNKSLRLYELTTKTAGRCHANGDEGRNDRAEIATLKSWYNNQLNGLDRRFQRFMHIKH